LRREFDVVELALLYERAGAAAISVITEEDFFCGSPEYVKVVRDAVSLPLLRKDFLFDEYQIYESRILGADAVLLIVAILDDIRISQLTRLAKELGMTALVEVHNEKELERALNCGCSLIGINNRNLKTMEVDVGIAKRMLKRIPSGITVVVESGIRSREDVERFEPLGVDAVLVGEAIVTATDLRQKIQALLGK
jgi:indole-3-glycerol phosphate synthase